MKLAMNEWCSIEKGFSYPKGKGNSMFIETKILAEHIYILILCSRDKWEIASKNLLKKENMTLII